MAKNAQSPQHTFGWIPAVALCLIITGMSHQTIDGADIYYFPHQDKVIHALVYGLIATTWLRWLTTFKTEFKAALWAITLTSTFGVIDEVHQSFVPGRYLDFFDWVADTAGATLATFCYLKWPLYRNILEWPKKPKQSGPRA